MKCLRDGTGQATPTGKLHSQAEHVILYIKVLAFGCRGHKVRRLPLNSDFSSHRTCKRCLGRNWGAYCTRESSPRTLQNAESGDEPSGKQFCRDFSTLSWRLEITPLQDTRSWSSLGNRLFWPPFCSSLRLPNVMC